MRPLLGEMRVSPNAKRFRQQVLSTMSRQRPHLHFAQALSAAQRAAMNGLARFSRVPSSVAAPSCLRLKFRNVSQTNDVLKTNNNRRAGCLARGKNKVGLPLGAQPCLFQESLHHVVVRGAREGLTNRRRI